MGEADFTGMITAVGVPGFLLFVGYKLALKYGFFDRDHPAPPREVMDKLDKMDSTAHEMNARLIRIEERQEYHSHRLNNLEQIRGASERTSSRHPK